MSALQGRVAVIGGRGPDALLAPVGKLGLSDLRKDFLDSVIIFARERRI